MSDATTATMEVAADIIARALHTGQIDELVGLMSAHKVADMAALAAAVVPILVAASATQRRQIATLTERLAEVEHRPLPEHTGSWKAGQSYEAMKMVQFQGSCWCALTATDQRPGDPDSGWRLVAKAGRDGRHVEARR